MIMHVNIFTLPIAHKSRSMKLSELLNEFAENQDVQNAVYEVLDAVLVMSLLEFRDRKIDDYEAVKDGQKRNIYVVNDLEQDAFEISRRIEAVDMILDEYKAGHEPYDFEAVEWWDDKSG